MNVRPRSVAIAAAAALVVACETSRPPVRPHAADALPDRLSAWGLLFVAEGKLSINDSVLPYDINTPLFSDYALKLRTVWMPAGTEAVYHAVREFEFPIGTILSKTFYYEKAEAFTRTALRVQKADRETMLDPDGVLNLDDNVLIETRLLVRYADGWKAFTYVWTALQDDALLAIAGAIRDVEFVTNEGFERIKYVVPDANQCAGCHTPDHASRSIRPLGPKAWQLNRDYDYRGTPANQLDYWRRNGKLTGVVPAPPRGPRWYAPADASTEERAKAYLDVNCAHCHNPAGAADSSALHLGIDAPVDRLHGVCKPPVAVGRGSGNLAYDIYPGRPEASILVYRMRHSDPAIAMPELGRSIAHVEGIAAVSAWIRGLPGVC